jgi:hypothetical protein
MEINYLNKTKIDQAATAANEIIASKKIVEL